MFLRRVIALMSDDLPTLERPINAYSGRSVSGHCEAALLLFTNSIF